MMANSTTIRLAVGLALFAVLCTTSCQRDETFSPESTAGNGFAIGLHMPPPGSWDQQVQASLQDSLEVWLYQLGTDPAAGFTQRPHPDDPSFPPFARAAGEGSEELVLEIDPVPVPTWWRIFVRRGQLLGQTTFTLTPPDREHIAHVVLGPETAAANRLVVYAAVPVGPGSSPPEGGGSLDASATLLFPVAVENPEPLTGLWMEFALELADECSIYADPGSRLFDSGDTLAYEFTVEPLPNQGDDCRTFALELIGGAQADPILAGSSILFYIASHGDTAATALCVNPQSVRFGGAAGIETLGPGQVVSPGACEYPTCTGSISSPIAGTVLCAGAETTITWETVVCCPVTLSVVLLHGGTVCDEITPSTANDGEYIWTVTACAEFNTGYQIALLDQDQHAIAMSAGFFSIEAACQPQITTPNGGEQYRAGENALIEWESSGCCGDLVRLELLRDGAPCLTIAESTANDGELTWTVAACEEQYGAYRVRITDLDTGAADHSNRSFIIAPPCVLDITYPDGGELLCTNQSATLTWGATELCASTVGLELLRDGASCSTIAAEAPNTGSFAWSVEPCLAGTGAYRLRVSDSQTGAADTSAADFTIVGGCALAVTQPSGSATVCEGYPVEITWTSSSCCGPAVRLVLLREGSLCQTIADSIPNNNSYTWTAARCEGSDHVYRVQVIDLTTGDAAVSAGTLQIDTCALAVTYPTGGAVLCEGDQVDITWTWSVCCGDGASVRLELLCDGLVCGTIAESTPNTGSLLWTVASATGAGVGFAIRVTDLASGESATGSPFAIASACAITVTGPLANDYICEGIPVDVTWTTTACCVPMVSVELLYQGQRCATLAAQTDNDGVFQWIPERCDLLTEDYEIRIIEVGGDVWGVTQGGAFSIHAPCEIDVIAPSGQESLCTGETFNIEWAATACCAETVTLELLRNGDACETIAVTPNDGFYTWTVSSCGTATDAYAIRITDPTSGLTGQSNTFAIRSCTIGVVHPVAGDALCVGGETIISWTYGACCGDAVAIELLRAGELCLTIADSVANNGRYNWVIDQCSGQADHYRVRVRDLASSALGVSATAFSIEPTCLVAVTAPTTGGELCPGEETTITWTASSCCPETFTIELLCDGQVCEFIAEGASGGSQAWAVSEEWAGTSGLSMRITPNDGSTAVEGGLFSILDECIPHLTYPNGNEVLCEGEQITITWSSTACCGSAVEIALLNGGELVEYLTTATSNDGQFAWTPERYNGISIGYSLRIRDLSTGAIDYTDAMFRINPSLTVTAPNGGEWYYVGETVPISWDTGACGGSTVRITLLSNDSPCLTIVSSTPNDGSYEGWDAVLCGDGGYKIQVTNLSTGSSDRSDATFIISL
jgi:hypothetical protein